MGVCNPKVSIIVPAYNQDGCIMRTIKSIQNQTLEDLEIIVVDDGSDDRTYDIAERITHRDIRLDLYQTDHIGLASVRNFALKKAKGKYIYFLNPGDWIEPGCLEDMVEVADADNLDLVVSGLFKDTSYNNGERNLTEIYTSDINCVFENVSDFRKSTYKLLDDELFDVLSNKLFKKSLIDSFNIEFKQDQKQGFFFVCDYIQNAQHAGLLKKAYLHMQLSRDEEQTSRWEPGLYDLREKEYSRLMEMFRSFGLDSDTLSMGVVYRIYLENLIECIENVCSPKCILAAAEKRRLIAKMINSDRAQVASGVVEPKSRMMQMMIGPINSKNVSLVYSEGRFISFIKRRNTKMFASLKADK